jgi:hypothetical protein
LVSIGIRVYGISREKVDDSYIPEVGKYFETIKQLNAPPPAGQELDFLRYIKQEMESKEHVYVNYASVEGTTLIVQWQSLGSPISVGAIILIIAVAIAFFGLAAVLHETYKIVTFIGPAAAQSIINIFGMIAVVMVISMILSFIPRLREHD